MNYPSDDHYKVFCSRATSTNGHLVKDSESGRLLVAEEKATSGLVEAKMSDIKIENQLQMNCSEGSSVSTKVKARLDVSSCIEKGKDFPIVKVTGELTIKSKNGEEPYGMTVLDDESVLICYGSGIARYNKSGLLMGRVKKDLEEFSFPSDNSDNFDICKFTDGNVVVLDSNGLHLLDRSLQFIKTLVENNTTCGDGTGIVRYSSLAEDEDGNMLTIANNLTNEPRRASVFVFDMKSENPVQIISLESLIEEAMVELKVAGPSLCTNLTYRDGRIYITGD